MQKLIVGVTTLVAVVVGFVLFTSFDSPAQENPADGDSTPTTVAEDDAPARERFGFGFRGDLPAEIDEFLACLEEQGIEVPDDPDRGFFFDLPSDEGLADALETCELPGLPFGGGMLDHFEGEFPDGFPFHHLPEDFLEDLPEGFGEGFPFGELPEDFLDGFPRFEMHRPFGPDRDALAECLMAGGSLDSVDEARARLDECLPGEPERFEHGPHGFRFHHGFDFDGWFDFGPEEPGDVSTSA